MTITSLKTKFEELKTFESVFGFLHDSQKLMFLDDNELKECCVKFHSTFSLGNLSDADVHDLLSELKVLQCTLPTETMNALDILKFVKFADCYPNVANAYKVLLTLPMTVAST